MKDRRESRVNRKILSLEENKREKKTKEKFLDLMDMPTELLQDTYRITMFGRKSILIEKYSSILEYDENIIRTSCGVNVHGTDLNIEEISDNEIFIIGNLLNVELEWFNKNRNILKN